MTATMANVPQCVALERWNDKAIDGLEGRVDDAENELATLRAILPRQAKIETALSSMLEAQRDFRDETRRRFDRIDADHGRSREETPTKQWLGVVVAIIGLIGVVLTSLVGAYVTLKTGAAK